MQNRLFSCILLCLSIVIASFFVFAVKPTFADPICSNNRINGSWDKFTCSYDNGATCVNVGGYSSHDCKEVYGLCGDCIPMGETCYVADGDCHIDTTQSGGTGICPPSSNWNFCDKGSGGGGGGGKNDCTSNSQCGVCGRCCGGNGGNYCSSKNYDCSGNKIPGCGYIPATPTPTPNPYRITGQLYADYNDNGKKESDEPGVGSVHIFASSTGQSNATTTTDSNGNFTLFNLAKAPYTVQVLQQDVPAHYIRSKKNNWFQSGVTPNPTANVIIGITPLFVSGDVYIDYNNNGKIDSYTYGSFTDVDAHVVDKSIKVCASSGKDEFVCTNVDEKGQFYIPNLNDKDYTVEVYPIPTGYSSSSHFYVKAHPRTSPLRLYLAPVHNISGYALDTTDIEPCSNKVKLSQIPSIVITDKSNNKMPLNTPVAGGYSATTINGIYTVTMTASNGYKFANCDNANQGGKHTYSADFKTAKYTASIHNGDDPNGSFWVYQNTYAISGYIYNDINGDCNTPAVYLSKEQFTVTYTPTNGTSGNASYISGGYATPKLPPGTYAVSVQPQHGFVLSSNCEASKNANPRSVTLSDNNINTIHFWLKPPTIAGVLCKKDNTSDCAQNDSPYPGDIKMRVYGDNIVVRPRPCDLVVGTPCIFDTRTFSPLDNLESVTAYGRYWNWSIKDGSLAGVGSMLDITNRWNHKNSGIAPDNWDGPCRFKANPDNPTPPCVFDTRTFSTDGTKEYVTAYGRFWVWDRETFKLLDSGDLSNAPSSPHWTAVGGPCNGKASHTCKFDTRTFAILNNLQVEGVTAYGRTWVWSYNTKTGKWEILSGLNGIDMTTTHHKGWNNGPCKGKPALGCSFTTRTFTIINGATVESVTTPDGKIWAWDSNQAIWGGVDGWELGDPDAHKAIAKYTSPSIPLTQPSGITPQRPYVASLLSTGRYYLAAFNIDPDWTIKYPSGCTTNTKCLIPVDVNDSVETQNLAFWPTNPHSISGKLFIDDGGSPVNKNNAQNGILDPGEQLYKDDNNPITVTIKKNDKFIDSKKITDGSSYVFTGLPAGGEYTVTYTLPGVYHFTYPRTGYSKIFLGPCNADNINPNKNTSGQALKTTCDNGDIKDLNQGVIKVTSWAKTYCGDIRLSGKVENIMPSCSPTPSMMDTNISVCTNDPTKPSGILFSGSVETPEVGQGTIGNQSDGWFVKGDKYTPINGYSKVSYDYLTHQQANIKNLATIPEAGCSLSGTIYTCVLSKTLPSGTYQIKDADAIFTLPGPQNSLNTNSSYTFLIGGNLTIASAIHVPKGSSAVFVAKNNITIDPTVGRAVATKICNPYDSGDNGCDIEGIFSSGNNFILDNGSNTCDKEPDRRLNIAGTVITNSQKLGGKIINQRNLCDQACNPTYTVTPRLDVLLTLPAIITHTNSIWKEVAP